MPEDLEFMLLIVGCFYLLECSQWVRPGCVVFVSQLGERAGMNSIPTRALLRNDWGGLLVGNLLPLGASAQCQSWPVSLAPAGVFSYVSQAITSEGRPDQPALFYRYEEVERVEADQRKVLVNGRSFVTVCSPDLAQLLARLIGKLTALPPERRAEAIDEALRQSTDTADISRRYREARWTTLPLRLLCTLLLGYLFLFVPIGVVYHYHWDVLRYLLFYGLVLVSIQLQFSLAARKLLPDEGRLVGKQVWLMLVSPADAIHAGNKLFRSLLSVYHPLAVARAVASLSVFEELARHVLRDLRQPIRPAPTGAAPEAVEVEAWFRERLEKTLAELVRGAGLDPEEVHAPPEPDGTASRTYCPRCWGQFVVAEGVCHGCGVPLRSVASRRVETSAGGEISEGRGSSHA